MPIALLDKKTIDQIAAGEVVERPSSVVKELVENAIDAHATAINIEIKDGGISLIRVTDDGCGIAPEEIPTAFMRHATSKIREIGDLDTLTTLGFRGEALSSIAAVSRVELITKRAEDLTATRCRIDGGKEISLDEIGAPDGTTMIVRDLFYNVPARAKFLKTALTESAHVGSYVEQLALSHPGIAFTYIQGGSARITTSGTGSLRDVIYHLYGKEVVKELIPIAHTDPDLGLTVEGFAARPVISRGNRAFENYYVNGRYVKNRVLMRAIEDGFGTRLMQHQYPFTTLFIDIDGSRVDVNVHPTKMEVRFSEEAAIYEAVRKAISDSLKESEMIVQPSLDNNNKIAPVVEEKTPEPFEHEARRQKEEASSDTPRPSVPSEAGSLFREASPYGAGSHSKLRSEPVAVPASAVSDEIAPGHVSGEDKGYGPAEPAPSDGKTSSVTGSGTFEQTTFGFLTEEARTRHKLIGQAFKTYWIVEFDKSLFIIDQHAAHEKVLYEQLIARYRERELASQTIDPAIVVSLTIKEELLLNEHMDAFESLGFVIEHLGGRDYAVRAVPYTLSALGSKELFREVLDHLEDTVKAEELDLYTHRVATEVCKAAVKGHDVLSFSEADRLIDDLLKLDDPYHCPHGRPTIIAFTQSELEKKFRRTV